MHKCQNCCMPGCLLIHLNITIQHVQTSKFDFFFLYRASTMLKNVFNSPPPSFSLNPVIKFSRITAKVFYSPWRIRVDVWQEGEGRETTVVVINRESIPKSNSEGHHCQTLLELHGEKVEILAWAGCWYHQGKLSLEYVLRTHRGNSVWAVQNIYLIVVYY